MILMKGLRFLYCMYADRPVENFFKKKTNKKVLISYITRPFRGENKTKTHTNSFEVMAAAKVFNELGYRVDVMHYLNPPSNLKKYDVIYGFGDVFQNYFESGLTGKKTIYYGAGMHVSHQNTASLNRVKDIYEKKGVWLAKSARFVEKTWSHQTCLVDSIIALGDHECKNTYKKYYKGPIYTLPAPFYQVLDANDISRKRDRTKSKNFLWFGSSGLVHKGLDLCLEYFSTRLDLTLHVCGSIFSEPDFMKLYDKELFKSPNIVVHGFVDIQSNQFKEIIGSCTFIIYPSCSEGGAPSVLTAIGNGALIPIVSHESSVSTGYEIFIESLDFLGIEKAIFEAENYSYDELSVMAEENLRVVLTNNSQDAYYSNLKEIISRIISDEVQNM
ncbi:hypothetical protein [Marinomonas sp.]